jgi:hypothetical protein
MTRPEPLHQIAFGQISLAHPPVANRIYGRQQLVERGITQRGMRHAFVKWLKPNAPGITFVPWPNWRQVVRGGNFSSPWPTPEELSFGRALYPYI